MDLVGKLKCSNNGNIYMCVMVDYFTKWMEVYPLKSKKAEQVSGCIMDFFYKYGAPKRILTDQGKEFVNKVSQIERHLISLYSCTSHHEWKNVSY